MITSKTASTTNSKKIAFAALHHKDFRAYFFATMLAMMADNIEHVISYWLLYEKFKSPVLAGFAVLSHWTPFLLFAVYFGALADRYDCRKVIQLAQIMYMGVSAAWAVLFFTGTIQVWHACVLLVIHGRGLNSGPEGPVLVRATRDWLTQGPLRKHVLAFASAPPERGGTGAMLVLLRRPPA